MFYCDIYNKIMIYMKYISLHECFYNIEKDIEKINNLFEESEVRKLIRSFEFKLLNEKNINKDVSKFLVDYLNGKINSKYYEIINNQYPDKDISEIYRLQYFEN